MNTDTITACAGSLVALVSAVPELTKRVFHVTDEDDLMATVKSTLYPCAGVIYVGTQPTDMTPSMQKTTGGSTVVSADISFTLMCLTKRPPSPSSNDQVAGLTTLIDSVRSSILSQRSPTGHFWRFMGEVQVPGKNGLIMYLQRWHTSVQLR